MPRYIVLLALAAQLCVITGCNGVGTTAVLAQSAYSAASLNGSYATSFNSSVGAELLAPDGSLPLFGAVGTLQFRRHRESKWDRHCSLRNQFMRSFINWNLHRPEHWPRNDNCHSGRLLWWMFRFGGLAGGSGSRATGSILQFRVKHWDGRISSKAIESRLVPLHRTSALGRSKQLSTAA